MICIADSVCSSLGPKILGTYEQKLHNAVLEMIASKPSSIVDVGAAEGYYAIGFARALPGCQATALEATLEGKQTLLQLAQRNGVSNRVDPCRFGTRNDLENFLASNPVDGMIMDVEGAEEELLSGPIPALLKRTILLVELHDFGSGKIREPLVERFHKTHIVEEIKAGERSPRDISSPLLRLFTILLRLIGLDYLYERQPRMSLLFITPPILT